MHEHILFVSLVSKKYPLIIVRVMTTTRRCFNSSGCFTLARNSLFQSKLIKKEGESPNLSIRRAITTDTSPKNFHGVPLYTRMMVIGRKIKWVFI